LIFYKFEDFENVIIWDIKENIEYDNLAGRQGDKFKFYCHGGIEKTMQDHSGAEIETELDNFSERGYLVFNNYYVDIDSMVPVPYIQVDGMDVPRRHWLMGQRNCLRYILTEGFLMASYAYTDIFFKGKLKN
jgi:hypothetical protein